MLGDDGLVEKDTKTHAARRVSLDRTTVAAMTAHRARAEERARLCEHELDRRAFVFSNEIDGPECWYPDSVSRAFARLCRKAGIKGVRMHDYADLVVVPTSARSSSSAEVRSRILSA